MPRRQLSARGASRLALAPRASHVAVALAAVLVLAGALAWFLPDLRRRQPSIAGTPTPSALFAVTRYTLPAHQQACMNNITIESNARAALFQVIPHNPTARGVSPLRLVLSGAGYRSSGLLRAGYGAGLVSVPISPPRRSLIGGACFVNEGPDSVTLNGSAESRTITRSYTILAEKPVVGGIALEFIDTRPRSIFDRLGEVFGHASNLTDRLVPVWLVWTIAILLALCVPAAMLLALYFALREEEAEPLGG